MYNLKNLNFTTVHTAWSESHLRSHFPPRLWRAHGDHFGVCRPHEPWLIMKLGLQASLSFPVRQRRFSFPGNVFQPTAVTFDYCCLRLPFLFPSTFVFKIFMVVASLIICLHLLFLIFFFFKVLILQYYTWGIWLTFCLPPYQKLYFYFLGYIYGF